MPKAGVGIVNLSTGQATTVAEHVKSFRVPDDVTPQVVVYLTAAEPAPARGNGGAPARARSRDKKVYGTDLVIRDLVTGTQTTIPKSASTRSTRTARGSSTACRRRRRRTKARSRAASPTASRKTLLAGPGNYKGFVFDDGGGQAAFVSDRDDARRRRRATSCISGRRQPTPRPNCRCRRAPRCRSATTAVSSFRRTATLVLRHRAAARGRARRGGRPDQGRHLELQGRRAAADAEGPRRAGTEADLSRGVPSRRQALRAAGDAATCPTCGPTTARRRRSASATCRTASWCRGTATTTTTTS